MRDLARRDYFTHLCAACTAGIRDEFRAEPADTDVVLGETATLQCRSPRGEPEPRLRWLKDGARLRLSGGGGSEAAARVTIDDHGSLTLRDARRDDAGSYVCVAWNAAAERHSAPALLTIRGIDGVSLCPSFQ